MTQNDPLLKYSNNCLGYDGEEIIDLLIEHGANINQRDSDGRTPLHNAIFGGHKKAIEMLIQKGSNINATENKFKMTPLHFMAIVDSSRLHHVGWTEDDSLKYTELLINRGADLYAKARYRDDDKTPLDMVTSEKVRKLLEIKMGFM